MSEPCRFNGTIVNWPWVCQTHHNPIQSIVTPHLPAACSDGLAALRARCEAQERRIIDLEAERGLLLNGASMVARVALPFIEGRNKQHPSHDTGEVLSEARAAIARRTPETNKLICAWMQAKKDELEAQERVIAGLVDSAGHTAACHFSGCTCGKVRKFADALLEANRLLRDGAIVRTKALSPTKEA